MSISLAQIIPKNIIAVEPNWQKELAKAFNDPNELLSYLQLDPADYVEHAKARKLFPMRVPKPFADRIQKGVPSDPLLAQVLPVSEEFISRPEFSRDPLLEQDNQQPGLLHKYQSRVLLIVRGGCAVNCRYCFRRHFPYGENHVGNKDWLDVVDYIRSDSQINEVILSGGDPLMAKDDFLAWLSQELESVPHLMRLRIHTRLPIVIPQRITPEFLQWFTQSRLKPVMVLHINHAQEIDNHLQIQLNRLSKAGITLLNQAVLLKGVNDSIDAQVALNERVFECGVMPYYLHMLDKVEGAGHFLVGDEKARSIMAGVIKRQPGFLVPKLVREIADQPGKTPLDLKLHP